MIPCSELKSQAAELRHEIMEAVGRVLESGWFVLGRELAAFEEEFAAYNGARHAVGVASGTEAIQLALAAVGVRPGDDVITQPNTCVPTICGITGAGARPVLADIDPVTCALDPAALARALTPRTRAIVPVHLYGHPCDMDPILEFAAARKLAVVEDCAQAVGTRYRGRLCGTFGHAAAFSFYPTKNLGACGDGGAVLTGDDAVAAELRMLRNYGEEKRYVHSRPGINSRLDEMQAAILRVKLKHLERWIDLRRERAARYAARLRDLEGITLPVEAPCARHTYHLYVIRTRWRAALQEHLKTRGVATLIHYPIPVHRQPAYAALDWPAAGFPHAERACDEVLSLPMFPELPLGAIDQVAEAVASFQP